MKETSLNTPQAFDDMQYGGFWDVLSAEEINGILNALHGALKEKLPRLREPSVGSMESCSASGAYGFLVFGILLFGKQEAKLTIIIEMETALKLASKLLNVPRLEAFSDDAQLVLEEIVRLAAQKLAPPFSQVLILPTLLEANTLLSYYPRTESLKISILTLWDPITLFVACPKVEENAASPNPEEVTHAA